MTEPKTFKAVFCEVHGCAPEKFYRKLFWRSLRRRAMPFALFIQLLRPNFFALDFQLMDEAGNACNIRELVAAINGFGQDCQVSQSFLHDDLRFRISGKRLLSVFKKTKMKAHQIRMATAQQPA